MFKKTTLAALIDMSEFYTAMDDGVIFVDNDSDNRTIFSANCYLWLP